MAGDVVRISFNGIPKGKGRPRARIQRGRTRNNDFAQIYTPPETRAYESAVRRIAAVVMRGRPPLQGRVAASIVIRIPIPPSFTKRRRAAILAGEDDEFFGLYDWDNLAKALLDACNDMVFLDDKQVMRATVVKVPSEEPGVDMRFERMTGPHG